MFIASVQDKWKQLLTKFIDYFDYFGEFTNSPRQNRNHHRFIRLTDKCGCLPTVKLKLKRAVVNFKSLW